MKKTKAKKKGVRAPAKKTPAAKKGSAKKSPAKKSPAKKGPAKKAAAKKASPTKATKRTAKRASKASLPKWVAFVEKHGVVLASAKGPVPSVAEAIAGEPIIGSWWSHPKAQAIFDALSEIDDDIDVRCFKLVDNKVTFVHRRLWPALVRLAQDGRIPADRAASIQQEHMPTGEHKNVVTPFPDWVPDEVGAAAQRLSADDAKQQLGAWA